MSQSAGCRHSGDLQQKEACFKHPEAGESVFQFPAQRGSGALEPKGSTPQKWAEEIRSVWTKGGENTIQLARALSQARRSLAYGEWNRLWQLPLLPFSRAKGYMLLAIGRSMADLDVQTFGHLPRGWSILYVLTRLDRESLLEAMAQRLVHPALGLNEAKELVERLAGRATTGKAHPSKLQVRLKNFTHFVVSMLPHCTPHQLDSVRGTLTDLLKLVECQDIALQSGQPQAVAMRKGNLETAHQLDQRFLDAPACN